jgi:hypothetical protein
MSERRMTHKRYRPMEVEDGWIVGLCAVRGDTDPTVLTEKGAREWAARLNARLEHRWFEIDPTPRPWRSLTPQQAGFWKGVQDVLTFGRRR